MGSATRSEVIFGHLMNALPNLVNENNVKIYRYVGNVLWRVGPPFQVFMMSAGEKFPQYVTIGVGKNLEARIKRLIRSSPVQTRVAVYTMVPSFKQALELREKLISKLDAAFPGVRGRGNDWYDLARARLRVPGNPGNMTDAFEKATLMLTKTVQQTPHATQLYRYEPAVKPEAIRGVREDVEGLRDAIESEMILH